MLLLTLLAGAASALVAPVVPRPRSARAAAAVELADCPVTQWGAIAEGLQTTKRALSHSRCHEECLERLSVAWKSAKGSEADAARRLIRRSENGRLTLGAPYAERLQTQIPTTKSRNDANASSS